MTQFNMVNSSEGPDPKRLLLAVVLSSAVLMAYSYIFAPTSTITQQPEQTVIARTDPPAVEKVADADIDLHEAATDPNITTVIMPFSVAESSSHQRTSYRVDISNTGAVINKFALTGFSEAKVLFDDEKLSSSLFKLSLKNPQCPLDEDARYEIVNHDNASITLRHVTARGLSVKRHYEFLTNATIREQITFTNLASSPMKLEPVLAARKKDVDVEEPGMMNPGVSGLSIAVKADDNYTRYAYADVKDKPKSITDVRYLAFDDQFFLAAIVPNYLDAIDHGEISSQEDSKAHSKVANLSLVLKPLVLVPGEEKTLTHQFFIGPKQIDLLSSFSVPLDENIDFGWFGVLSRPMLWLLVMIFSFVKNYGLAIILITLVIKLLTYPLTQKSFTSQQEMKVLQPKIKDLQQKFGHDKTLLGQKQMELYKTHGINPLAGCLPMLIQLPIWFAFFQMLRNSVELFDQPFYLWITDLTRPDQYFVLPILMGVSMIVQQAFTPTPTDQPHMKYVMWAMPVFLTFIMLNMPSGLSLYILTNNILTIFQQLLIKRNSEKVTA